MSDTKRTIAEDVKAARVQHWYWVIRAPSGYFIPTTLRVSRRNSINTWVNVESHKHQTWEQHYRQGFRCVHVTVIAKETDHA